MRGKLGMKAFREPASICGQIHVTGVTRICHYRFMVRMRARFAVEAIHGNFVFLRKSFHWFDRTEIGFICESTADRQQFVL